MEKKLTLIALVATASFALWTGFKICSEPKEVKKILKKTHIEVETRPRILFHGSSKKDIDSIKPQSVHVRDKEEGPVVFAMPNIDVASMWLMSKQSGKTIKGNFNGKAFHFIYKGSKAEFNKQDSGGAIYCLASDDFYFIPTKGMGANEWVKKESAKPLHAFEFNSALDAMLDFGVQVYFIEDSDLFDTLKNMLNLGKFKDFQNQLNQLISENQSQNRNILPIC